MPRPAPGPDGSWRAVLFDVGGTLLDVADPEGWQLCAQELGLELPADRLAAEFRAALREFDPDGPPESDPAFWQEVLGRAAERTVPPSLAAAFLQRIAERPSPPRLYSDVRWCLDELGRRRLVLAVVSNSRSEAQVRSHLEDTGILGRFSVVVSSGTEGVRKPDPEIFRRALSRLRVAAGHAFFVGDLPRTDVEAARGAGLGAVWLNRDGTGMDDDITSLTELPGLLDRTAHRSR